MHNYRVILVMHIWMNSRLLSTLTNSSIIRKIMDKELEYGEVMNQIALFHMAWRFHEGGQEFGWFSRDDASYVPTRNTNAPGIGNGHDTIAPSSGSM